MNDKNKNLLIRIASSLVLLPLTILFFYKGGWWFALWLSWAAGSCAFEYYDIVFEKKRSPATWLGVLAAIVFPLLPVISPARAGELSFGVVAFFFFFAWSFYLLRGPLHEAPTLAAHLVTGLLFGGIGMGALSSVRVYHGVGWGIATATVTWANDTAAYFFGRFLGKHKLYPAVSPNKTWEGFFGGMVGSVGGLFVVSALFPEVTWVDAIVLGILGGITGPLGDLAESMLKRAYNVKDSGKMIPGHGGMLDRLDALLVNSAVAFLYVTFLRGYFL